VKAFAMFDVYIEQPCLTYEECLSVAGGTPRTRSSSTKTSIASKMLLRGHRRSCDGCLNLKISKFRRLTKRRAQARDLCGTWAWP